jgi:hypothetical protein
LLTVLILQYSSAVVGQKPWKDNIRVVLENTTPLKFSRGNRLPLYLWPAMDPGVLSSDSAELLVNELDRRGVGLICTWSNRNLENCLKQCLPVAKAQKKLGLRININATPLLDSFFNGDERTAHIDGNGKPFFDDSFGDHKMGCPFSLDFRKKEIRDRFELFVSRYRDEGMTVDFIFTDWEIDGPLEVNRAYEASKKCIRCREYMGEDFTFEEFRKTMREMRSYLQYYAYSQPVLSAFPSALTGNYAVYPNDGYRYWYDYFEYYVGGQPYKPDRQAKYRTWFNDFPLTGFTYAMPVVYPWDQIFSWYDFANTDYRWFYNMLLAAGNAGKSTPRNIPVISFVHWNTIFVTRKPDPSVKQMSRQAYRELLWHMVLRGTDTFFMWSGKQEYPEEVKLLHEVYAGAQQYGDFLENGMPVTWDIPREPGTVISGLINGDRVLIRRTDFNNDHRPVNVIAGTKVIQVSYAPGVCQIIRLSD